MAGRWASEQLSRHGAAAALSPAPALSPGDQQTQLAQPSAPVCAHGAVVTDVGGTVRCALVTVKGLSGHDLESTLKDSPGERQARKRGPGNVQGVCDSVFTSVKWVHGQQCLLRGCQGAPTHQRTKSTHNSACHLVNARTALPTVTATAIAIRMDKTEPKPLSLWWRNVLGIRSGAGLEGARKLDLGAGQSRAQRPILCGPSAFPPPPLLPSKMRRPPCPQIQASSVGTRGGGAAQH